MADVALMPEPGQDKTAGLLEDGDIPKTYKEVEKLVIHLYGTARRGVLIAYWNIGKVATALKENASYGSNAVEKIADKLGQQPRMLYEMMRFYEEHEAKVMPGLLLEWSSARELLRIKDKDRRLQLEQHVQKKGMTVREVRAMVNEEQKKKGAKKSENRGRKPSAKGFFSKFDHRLELMLTDLKKLLELYPERVVLLLDTTKTPDEDRVAVIGNKQHKGLAAAIADKGRRLVSQLQVYVVEMPDALVSKPPKTKSA